MVERQGKTVQEDRKGMTEVRDRGGKAEDAQQRGKGESADKIPTTQICRALGLPGPAEVHLLTVQPHPHQGCGGEAFPLSPRVTRMPESSGRVASELSFQLLLRGFLSSQPVFQESIS